MADPVLQMERDAAQHHASMAVERAEELLAINAELADAVERLVVWIGAKGSMCGCDRAECANSGCRLAFWARALLVRNKAVTRGC